MAYRYERYGWIEQLSREVYQFTGDRLLLAECLQFLGGQVKGIHVGGKTALSWRGVAPDVFAEPNFVI